MTLKALTPWVAATLGALLCLAAPASAAPTKAACAGLKGTAFAGVQDAPTSVMSATWVAAKDGRPEHCEVEGYVSRNNGFVLWLPTEWNGKLLARGCGGFCGITAGEFACKDPIRIGYACLQTDMGHKSGITDGAWALDSTEAKIDFGSRATHVTTLAGKTIIAAYYARGPDRSYFLGCSTGGRQGLVEAQRFPLDYEGIVSIAPALNETGASMQLAWSLLANRTADGHNILPQSKLPMLHKAVVEACDLNDGIRDGLIGDPKLCQFRPASLTCKGGADAPDCLTPAQVAVVERIYAGPSNRTGWLFPTGGAPLGSEGHWDQGYIGPGDAWGKDTGLLTDFWRYLGFDPAPGPAFTLDRFDFDKDPPRAGQMEAIYNAGNPDLRQFKARGGKLLLAAGMADDNVVPGGTLDYYAGVVRFMGGADATRGFARLFKPAGMLHCTGGEGAYAIDYLAALEAWVEHGQAPERLASAHPKDGVTVPYLGVGLALAPDQVAFRRPADAWPAETRYRGKGDPNDQASWSAK